MDSNKLLYEAILLLATMLIYIHFLSAFWVLISYLDSSDVNWAQIRGILSEYTLIITSVGNH